MIYIEGITNKPKTIEHELAKKYNMPLPAIRAMCNSPFDFVKNIMLGIYPYKVAVIPNFGIFTLRGFYYTNGLDYEYLQDYYSAKNKKRLRASFFKARRKMLRSGRRTREMYVEPELLSDW
jgi:hypothetical protein